MLRCALLALIVLGSHAEASAQMPALAADPQEVDHELTWYGWQSLIADSVVAGAVLVLDRRLILLTAAVGPTVHALNDNYVAVGVSFSVRFTGLLLYGLGAVRNWGDGLKDECNVSAWEEEPLDCDDPIDRGDELMATGAVLLTIAIAMDALIGFKREPIERKATSWSVNPWVDAEQRGGGLRLAGTL